MNADPTALLLAALLLVHLLAGAGWVGGMATMHWAVRPAVAATLADPLQRLGLMAAILGRFLAGVGLAIAAVLASGAGLLALQGGFAGQPPRVHAMTGLALVMTLVYALIRGRWFVELRAAVARKEPPAAAAALQRIRRAVGFNLALGVLVFAAGAARYG